MTFLALRSASGKGFIGWLSSWLIRARLVTRYPHAGIVVDGILYHAQAQGGVTAEPFDANGWSLLPLGEGIGVRTKALYQRHKGAGYDWFSLLAFVIPSARDSRRWYCYEWCFECMTGEHPKTRVTVEDLLILRS